MTRKPRRQRSKKSGYQLALFHDRLQKLSTRAVDALVESRSMNARGIYIMMYGDVSNQYAQQQYRKAAYTELRDVCMVLLCSAATTQIRHQLFACISAADSSQFSLFTFSAMLVRMLVKIQ